MASSSRTTWLSAVVVGVALLACKESAEQKGGPTASAQPTSAASLGSVSRKELRTALETSGYKVTRDDGNMGTSLTSLEGMAFEKDGHTGAFSMRTFMEPKDRDGAYKVAGKRALLVDIARPDFPKRDAQKVLDAILEVKPLAELTKSDIVSSLKKQGFEGMDAQVDPEVGETEVTADKGDLSLTLDLWDYAKQGAVLSTEKRIIWLDTGAGADSSSKLLSTLVKVP